MTILDLIQSKSFKSILPLLLMLMILWLGFAVRLHQLDTQSLWYDEGVAFGHSQRNLWQMIPRLQDNVHVPAYFASLAVYENFVGSTEFGLRSYSVLWSIISVATVYALGRRLFHPIVGLSASMLVALNSFSIYYAQETRMYAMLSAIAVLSLWAFVRWGLLALTASDGQASRKLWGWAIAFAILNIVGAYTHLSYALVMLTQGVMAILLIGNLFLRALAKDVPMQSVWRILGMYLAVNLLTLIVFAPWLVVAISQISAQPNLSAPIELPVMLRLLQGWFAFGLTFDDGTGGMQVVVYFLLLFGLLRITDERESAWWRLLIPIVWVVLSSGIYLYLELYARYLRFLLPAQIGFALWMGRGVWVLWEIIPRTLEQHSGLQRSVRQHLPKFVATFAIVAFGWQQFTLIAPLHNNPDYQRDDYRSLVAEIEAQARPQDAIILSAPGLQEIFGYYYEGDLPVYTLPASADIVADTEAIISQHERVYVVLYGNREQDPDGLVTDTLNTFGFPIGGEWVGDVRFERFASPAIFPPADEVNLAFGEAITLDSVALNRTAVSPNDALQVQLTWTTSQPLTTRYKIFLQLFDSAGQLVAQRDSEPSGNQAPTTSWQVDTPIVDNHALAIPDLPAGAYTLIAGVYERDNPQNRLSVADGDFVTLATIFVETP